MTAAEEQGQRRRAVLAVAVAVAVALAVALVRPGGSIAGADTESVVVDGPLPPLTSGSSLLQRFTASDDGLSSVSVRIGTYGGNARCSLRVSLRPATLPGAPVASRTLGCESIRDSQLREVLRFAPLDDSADQTYELSVTSERPSEDGVSLFGGALSNLPEAVIDGVRLRQSVELHSGYGRAAHAYDLIGEALRRMGAYGPAWEEGAVVIGFAFLAFGSLVALAFVPRRRLLLTLVVFAVAKGVIWSSVLPPLEGVDEIPHVAYAQFLGEQRRIPDRGDPVEGDGLETFSQELDVVANTFRVTARPPGDRPDLGPRADEISDGFRNLDRRATGDGPAAGYAPHYYVVPALLERLPATLEVRIVYMRLWSIALGAATVALAWMFGSRAFPRHPTAALLLGIGVALQPMLSQQTAIVNNDAAVVAAGAWTLVVALDLAASRRRSSSLLLAAGVAGGLTFVVKGFGVGAVPILAVAWAIGRARGLRPSAWWRDIAAAAGGFLLSYGTWFVVAAWLGLAGVGLSGEPSEGPRGVRAFLAALRSEWFLPIRQNWVDHYWGVFSWIDTPFPDWTRTVILVAVLIGVAIVSTWLFRAGSWAARTVWAKRRELAPPAPLGDPAVHVPILVSVVAVAAMLGVLYVIMFLHFQDVGRLDLIQGRYALLITPAVLALPAAAAHGLNTRVSPVPVMATVATAMGMLNVLGLVLLVERFFL